LYVVRIDRSCSLKDSAPCSDCMKVIKALNIKRIIFSTDSGGFMSVKPSEFVTTHMSQGRRLLDNGVKVNPTIQYKSSI
jgi:deoxycytidylate deaminase